MGEACRHAVALRGWMDEDEGEGDFTTVALATWTGRTTDTNCAYISHGDAVLVQAEDKGGREQRIGVHFKPT